MPKDFVTTSVVKAANRTFTAPVISASAFDGIIATLIGETNPLGATPYNTAGETIAGVTVTDESYKATIEFFDENTGSTIGNIVVTAPKRSIYDAVIAHIENDATLAGLFGGAGYHNDAKDSWAVRTRVHDPTGELYYLNFARKTLRLSSFENDAILGKVDAWADTVPELN